MLSNIVWTGIITSCCKDTQINEKTHEGKLIWKREEHNMKILPVLITAAP
jgi:hypothetical protein